MELQDRYLQAVKFWLPQGQKQDIIAELSDEIRSQIKEKETELGRMPTQVEVEAILKQIGRPVLVANRYLPQQSLIGPLLFPIYWFVLKLVALCYLAPRILLWVGLMGFDPGYRARHFGGSVIGTLASLWGSLWITALLGFALVTIVFAVLERAQAKSGFLERWDPRKLPAVRDPNQIPRASSIVELVANIVFLMWWIRMRSPIVLGQSAVITLTPVWQYFFYGFVLLVLANIATSSANLIRPYWTRIRAGARLVTDLIGAALFCWMCNSEVLAGISVPGVAPSKLVQISDAINLWMSRSFPIVLLIGIVIALFDVRRIIRAKTTDTGLTGGVFAGG